MSEGNKVGFFKGIRGEFNKIVWPGKATLTKSVTTVLVVVAILGLIVSGLDTLFHYLVFDVLLKVF